MSKVLPKDFAGIKEQYLIDVKSVVNFEDIIKQLILNWDQTAVKVVPSASWTMEKFGLNLRKISADDDNTRLLLFCLCYVWHIFACSSIIEYNCNC